MSERRMKQLFIVRADLKMRSGKVGAQCGHAEAAYYRSLRLDINKHHVPLEEEWFAKHGQRKITLAVNSEEDLHLVHQAARGHEISTFLIIDSGTTEFHGVLTPTVVSVGPDYDDVIDPLFGKDSPLWTEGRLRLY